VEGGERGDNKRGEEKEGATPLSNSGKQKSVPKARERKAGERKA